ncbi:MAG: single-stranded-DNA-specific exonuclease RecJ [Flavobacteriaceae bacterium]|nr:single-stranded-DNA-specific exonuclease RecJ [Flavobacteriaceae bacterium]|tara:strand:- start:5071 stop:6762 length:1692 start_codon:yes stop_codon:yes gene_type:complete
MNWVKINTPNQNEIDSLAKELSVDLLISKILIQRGVNTFNKAKKFFRPNLNDLYDPFLMKDMNIAVDRIQKAISKKEKILIYGDYDVDGVTSVALVYSYLIKNYSNIIKYIPDRYKEGYGISIEGIDYARSEKVKLIISLDCGITAFDKIDYANELEIDFIICDHHIPLENIPNAVAVLDPKRKDCNYPFKELCGCGIGFKLIQALNIVNNRPFDDLKLYLDLVSIAIAADIVPLIDENRILSFYGIEQINKNPRVGLREMINSVNSKIKINDLIFRIAPRINSSGRMDKAMKSVELLIQKNDKYINGLSKKIEFFNTERRIKQEIMINEAIEEIGNKKDKNTFSITVYNEDWHKGIIGIVASKLVDYYYKPTIVLTKSENLIVGSVRSVKGLDIYNVLKKCKNVLTQFGGHKYAAGLTLKKNKLDEFKKMFEENVKSSISEDQRIRSINYDSEIKFNDINNKLYRILDQLAPFGPKNSIPLFVTHKCQDTGASRLVGKDKDHLRIEVIDSHGGIMSGIAFSKGNYISEIKKKIFFSILYSIHRNEFNGKNNIELNVKDFRFD